MPISQPLVPDGDCSEIKVYWVVSESNITVYQPLPLILSPFGCKSLVLSSRSEEQGQPRISSNATLLLNRFLPTGLLSTHQKYQLLCKILPKIPFFKVAQIKKNDHFKNTIFQNFDPKRFDYSLKLFFFFKLPLGTNRLGKRHQAY